MAGVAGSSSLLPPKRDAVSKNIPRTYLGPAGHHIVDMYNNFRKAKWIDTPKNEGEFFAELFLSFGLMLFPSSGWEALAYELRLIELSLPQRPRLETKGRAQLATECVKLQLNCDTLLTNLAKFTQNFDILVALSMTNVRLYDSIVSLNLLKNDLIKVETHLRSLNQPPKWRQTQMRSMRVELAWKLSELFEDQFQRPAKPVGGSASLSLDQTNDWTRFFQSIASVFLAESVTPDRQAVLWEAASYEP